MSLATSLAVLARHHDNQQSKFTTAEFCSILESAVKFMQTKHKQGGPVLDTLAEEEGKAFLVLLWQAIHAGEFYMLACAVVLFYEYIRTLDEEIELVWKRGKVCIVQATFLLIRYLPLATFLFVIAGTQYANSDHEFCTRDFAHVPPALIVFCETFIGVLRIIKIRALWNNEFTNTMAIIVGVVFFTQLALATACAIAVQGIGPIYGNGTQFGCFLIFQEGSMPRLVLHWFTNIVFNLLIFYSILRKSLSIRVLGNKGQWSLSGLVLRDGVLLFAVMLAVNVTNLLMLVVFPYWNAINWLFSIIADVILTSRLLFNVRAELAAHDEATMDSLVVGQEPLV